MDDCRYTTHSPYGSLSAHRHRDAYAALVLDGSYSEQSIDGRYACGPGMLLVHPAWHAHANDFGDGGAVVLNLPLTGADGLYAFDVPDAGAIERLAQRDPWRAGLAACEEADARTPVAPAPWLARLAALLASDAHASIGELAARCGVTPAHASRACKRWFGAGPAALRREGRLRIAIRLLSTGTTPADAAIAAGFSDQPHFTRLLKRATGLTPAKLAAP